MCITCQMEKKIDTMSAKTLFEHDDNRYNGFYSVTVQDEDGQVYSETALRDLPAIDFVARKSTLTRTVSTKPRVEEQNAGYKLGMQKGRWYSFRSYME